MRLAVIADIHGNRVALDAVLADIERRQVSCIVNLGDHASGPLEAARTLDRLMELDAQAIRGNHDRWLIEQERGQMSPSDAHAYDQLDHRHLEWLRALPETASLEDVFLCHGTPQSDTGYWLDEVLADGTVNRRAPGAIERLAEGIEQSMILCGHTHIPRAVRLSDGRIVLNPGSVGCPGYDAADPVAHIVQAGTPHASYAIIETADRGWNIAFHLVPYDHEKPAAMAKANGRPEWASALASGWIEGL